MKDSAADRFPAFEDCPSAGLIAEWFLVEKRGQSNVGGDAWWLGRNPHGSCRMLAFVDHDTQEFFLLDVTTDDSVGRAVSDLLWVTYGLDGQGVTWWQHPICNSEVDAYDSRYWHRDGLVWMADQIVLHYEGLEMQRNNDALRAEKLVSEREVTP